MATRRVIVVAATLMAVACGGDDAVVIHEVQGPTMGSTYHVKYVGEAALDDVRATVKDVLDDFEDTFSLWRDDSEIAVVNRAEAQAPLPVSPLFRSVLATALSVAERTDGAFDPTVEPLTKLYRRQQRGGVEPSAKEWAAAREHVGFRGLHLTPSGLVKDDPAIELDLDGIVAGACADAMASRLRRLPVRGAMLEITGEVLCFGDKALGVPWEIGIESPSEDGLVRRVALHDEALCTSGSYRNWLVVGGRPRHHILDPRTGENAANQVVSMSVRARAAALADALATALMVIGPDRADATLSRWPSEPSLGALLVLAAEPGRTTVRAVRWPTP